MLNTRLYKGFIPTLLRSWTLDSGDWINLSWTSIYCYIVTMIAYHDNFDTSVLTNSLLKSYYMSWASMIFVLNACPERRKDLKCIYFLWLF